MTIVSMFERRWWWGGPRDLWVKQAPFIAKFIDANRLQPLDREFFGGTTPKAARKEEAMDLLPIPFPGGMKTAHLHFKGDVYLVNPEQWKKFAAAVMDEYKTRLARAGAVSFDELLTVADALEGVV